MNQADIDVPDVGWVSDTVTQQIQEQSAKYGVDAELSSDATLTRSTMLPKGWAYTRIGDVSNKCEQRKPADEVELIYVDIGSIDRDLKRITEPQRLIGKDAPSRARKIINSGDVLVSLTRPNLNAVAVISEEFDNQIASTGFEVIKPIKVNSKYLFGIVRSKAFVDAVSGKVQGALYPAAKSDDVREYKFPLPPLAEQQQIAAKLDELLAQVDTLKTRLNAIPKILKRFRQSVIAAAVSGRLTEDWRGTKPLGSVVTIGEVASDIRYGTSKKCDYETGNIPVIRIPNIDNGFLNLNDLKFADFDEKELKNLSLVVGDLLLIRSNGSVDLVGKTALITEKDIHCLYAGYLIRIRLNQQMVMPKYLLYCLQSLQIRKVIEIQARSTSGVNNINSKELAALKFLLPHLEEQTEIVTRVEQLFTYADQIEQRVKDAQARVNHLTQSILAKAFRGELTADWREQNPDLISGENSAEALLARIQTEQGARPLKKAKKQL
ncbi:MAG: restriction endonuclease subunit S [Methylobacter sp.]